jgi:hypothetical protein
VDWAHNVAQPRSRAIPSEAVVFISVEGKIRLANGAGEIMPAWKPIPRWWSTLHFRARIHSLKEKNADSQTGLGLEFNPIRQGGVILEAKPVTAV